MNRTSSYSFSAAFLCLLISACADRESRQSSDLLQEKELQGVVDVGANHFKYFVQGQGITCLVVGDALTPSRALSDELREHFKFVFLESRMTVPSVNEGEISRLTMEVLLKRGGSATRKVPSNFIPQGNLRKNGSVSENAVL